MSSAADVHRSVESLQQVYAVIIALAIGHAILMLLVDFSTGALVHWTAIANRLPNFLAFVVVVVPFYHGMNRHLDLCYRERPRGDHTRLALLFDVLVFFFEAVLLFAAAASMSQGLTSFVVLGLLLASDIPWALVSHIVHYRPRAMSPSIRRWSVVNTITILVGAFVYCLEVGGPPTTAWLLFAVAAARSVADYSLCAEFYFPTTVYQGEPVR